MQSETKGFCLYSALLSLAASLLAEASVLEEVDEADVLLDACSVFSAEAVLLDASALDSALDSLFDSLFDSLADELTELDELLWLLEELSLGLEALELCELLSLEEVLL